VADAQLSSSLQRCTHICGSSSSGSSSSDQDITQAMPSETRPCADSAQQTATRLVYCRTNCLLDVALDNIQVMPTKQYALTLPLQWGAGSMALMLWLDW
jgi:hypothetical protein